jgi:hypothetical protein
VALPLLAPYAPEARFAARSLHVFARRPNANHTKVEVDDGADAGDLKKAVLAELRLDAPPDCVSLLREVEGGGAPAPLDSPPDATVGVARFILQLCETGPPLRLLPPYNALLRSWIASDGSVSISAEGTRLEESVWRNLAALSTFSAVFMTREKGVGVAISEAVLHVLARNGAGAPLAGSKAGDISAPTTVEEL